MNINVHYPYEMYTFSTKFTRIFFTRFAIHDYQTFSYYKNYSNNQLYNIKGTTLFFVHIYCILDFFLSFFLPSSLKALTILHTNIYSIFINKMTSKKKYMMISLIKMSF